MQVLYLWVVVPPPFESLVYEADFEVPLKPGGGSWRPLRLLHGRFFSAEEQQEEEENILEAMLQ